ncbi:hypothetical protein GQ42DRAFT_164683 [Ramicandelaber brevisporus]|nr:hypothetical protein GQ42DRAFT_164683 [Ramicandelaber brevisporus]
MVRGFLSYHTGCFTKSADETGNGDGYSTLMVYLMARGLPEFLFGRSKANPDKKTLSDSGLISWWHHVLSSSFVDSGFASGVTMSKHWLVPGLDESEAKRLLSSQTSASQKWNYNLPYNPTDLARKVVPSFPDDAKSRLLSKPEARSWTVAEMLQMMEHSEEFASGRRAGLFVVNVSCPASSGSKAAPLGINFKYRPPHLDMSEQQRDAFRICMFDWEIDFSNERANKESSAKIIRHIVNKFGGYNGALAKGEYIRKTATENGTAANNTATAKTVAPVANVLQVRSKRKAKPSDAEPATSKPKLD